MLIPGFSQQQNEGIWQTGYKVINVKERMEKDNLSARDALIKILDENKLVRVSNQNATNATAKIVIYFPADDYDLQPKGVTDKFP